MNKKPIGYQVESIDGKHEIPDQFWSFEILSNTIADNFISKNPLKWVKKPIYRGDIENPTFIS